MFEHMRRRTEDIIRYYGELNRRIERTGIDGVPRLLETVTIVERALGEMTTQELVWVSDEIKRLLDELIEMESQLQRLRELKTAIADGPHQEETPRKRSAL
jgi:inactivated superfamily I helicase